MYIFFIINSALTESQAINTNSAFCVVLAVLLHYFLLASFTWMLVMGIIQYVMFVKVFPFYASNFTIKAGLLSWGTSFNLF